MLTLFKNQNGNEYYTISEALETYIDDLNWKLEYNDKFEEINLYDLCFDLFNRENYLVYTNQIEKALESFGLFKALEIIQDHYEETGIEIGIKFGNILAISDSLWSILGETILQKIITKNDYNDTIESKEQLKEIIEYLEKWKLSL